MLTAAPARPARAAGWQFGVLGPVTMRLGERALPLGGPRQRGLLAVLLLHANRVVAVDRLVEALWAPDPPRTATAQVHTAVSLLRKSIAAASNGAGRPVAMPLQSRPPGYLLAVAPGQLDLEVFRSLAAAGRRALAQGDAGSAGEQLRAALGLWRGAALEDLADCPFRQPGAARLEEERLAALQDRIDADLALGRHAELTAELRGLVAALPLRERPWAQLMLALYRSGRQAEALAAFTQVRELLVDDLGVEPGAELQRLQQQVLAADPALSLPRAHTPATTLGPRSPEGPPQPAARDRRAAGFASQLPPDIADFAGRDAPVRQACGWLGGPAGLSDPVPIVVVSGKPGIGKTAFAVHVAHRLVPHFDTRLYVNLRGVDGAPLEPTLVLGRLLRLLGVEGATVPEGLDERAELYRARVAAQRVLVVLDNAADQRQVRPLLPGSPTGAVLVTSRVRLTGLEGALRVELDALSTAEAITLLGRIVGPKRVAAEPTAAATVVRLCGLLPLAVRVSGAKLAARPNWTLGRQAARLADERGRLDELAHGDLEVRASVASSYQGLDGDARRLFRLLGLLDAADCAAWAAAAALRAPVGRAEELLDRLVDAQLLDVTGPDQAGQVRYRFHELLRVYARERAAAEETAQDRAAAVARALGAWLALAEQADDRLANPFSQALHGDTTRWPVDHQTARGCLRDPGAWLEAERAALVAGVGQAATAGMDELAWELASSLTQFLEDGSHFDDLRLCAEDALRATRHAGNRRGEAVCLLVLGKLHLALSRYHESASCCRAAAGTLAGLGDGHGQAVALLAGAIAMRHGGRLLAARHDAQEALALMDRAGDRREQAYALAVLGMVDVDQGRIGPAAACYELALGRYREAGNRRGEAEALRRLGLAEFHQGRHDQAVALVERALPVFRECGDRHGEANTLQTLGEARIGQGRPGEALVALGHALDWYRQVGFRNGQAHSLRSLGEAHLACGRHDQAIACLHDALALWRDLGVPLWELRTLRSLAKAYAEVGRDQEAAAARARGASIASTLTPMLQDTPTMTPLAAGAVDGARP